MKLHAANRYLLKRPSLPIIADILTTIAVMLIQTALGLAIGISALEPRDVGQKVGTGATIWRIVSAIIAFFLDG